jgi:ankyrin repeat protein
MISKAILTTLKHQYKWVKIDLWLLLGITLGSALIIRLFPVPDWISILCLFILFFSAIKFLSDNTLRSNNGSAFSWKFIIGLPLSKEEVLLLNILSGLFLTLPLFFILFSYWGLLEKIVFEESHNLPLVTANVFLCTAYVYITTTYSLIVHPRKEFQKKNATNQMVLFLKNLSVFFCVGFYILLFVEILEDKFDLEFYKILLKVGDSIGYVINGWWLVPILLVFNILFYQKTLRVWNNEKLSYKQLNWNPKKEYSILFVCTLLFAIGVYNSDFKTSSMYQGETQKLVYKKDYQSLKVKLNSENINNKNKYGFTPMFVALHEGNVEMVKFLENKGANFDGVINYKKSHKGYDAYMLAVDSNNSEVLDYMIAKKFVVNINQKNAGFAPIHLASAHCNSKLVDQLIKAGADINNVNDHGETPLIVATRVHCFSVAVTLKEAGADFNLKNKKSQTALDLITSEKNSNYREFKYFLEKNTRIPASN